MTVYRFPYCRHRSDKNADPILQFKNEPLLDVGLLNKKNEKQTKVITYIDTGSQWCLFDKQYAYCLGIRNYDSGQRYPFGGVGGPNANAAYFHDLTLIVYTQPNKLDFDTAIKIDTKIGFVEKEFGFGGILGVYGFLDRFVFTTNIPQCYFELKNIL